MSGGRDESEKIGALPRTDGELASRILELVRSIRFGSIEVVIHEGRVVQVERREKLRFDR
jgi:hypothetical protein